MNAADQCSQVLVVDHVVESRPNGPRRFRLCMSADGTAIELRPFLPHLEDCALVEAAHGNTTIVVPSPANVGIFDDGVPMQPLPLDRTTTAELDAHEAAYFEEDPWLSYADSYFPIAVSGKKGGGCGRRQQTGCPSEYHRFQPPPLPPEPPSRWTFLIAKLLRREGCWLYEGPVPFAFRRRGLVASLREVRKWERRHGQREELITPWAQRQEARARGVLLRHEARQAAAAAGKGSATVPQAKRPAAPASSSSSAPVSRSRQEASGGNSLSGGFSDADIAAAMAQSIGLSGDALLAMQLGLDEETYRMLKALETRDIRPEDYDLLGTLDENLQKKTLDVKRLRLFPTETFQKQNFTVPDATAGDALGFWYWRPEDNDAGLLDGQTMAMSLDSDDACGVCLLDFEAGDELRTLLPCGHRFHKECIDHWLLEASTCCPVDKRDLLDD